MINASRDSFIYSLYAYSSPPAYPPVSLAFVAPFRRFYMPVVSTAFVLQQGTATALWRNGCILWTRIRRANAAEIVSRFENSGLSIASCSYLKFDERTCRRFCDDAIIYILMFEIELTRRRTSSSSFFIFKKWRDWYLLYSWTNMLRV